MFLLEALLITFLFWADIHRWHHVVILSKTPYLVAIGWISLRLRGQSWRSVGLCRPLNWARVLLLGTAVGGLMEGAELFITQPLLTRAFHRPPDLSAVSGLHSNIGMLAVGELLTWTLAAFGEELVWRAYLLNRVADVLGQTGLAWAISAALNSVAFGVAHFDQGVTGIAENVIDGALLCCLYFAGGRNLWLPIVAHGITDTLDLVLLFSGHYPLA